jgi:hypothetical protein
MKDFALVVPLGPGHAEVRRFHDLLDSLWSYERDASLCVVVDSSPYVRSVAPRQCPCRIITLRNPFGGEGEPLMGRLSASLLAAFDLVRCAGPFDFVLRADTDALVAGKFCETVNRFLSEHPRTGMVGTLGFTCRRDSPHYGCEKTAVSDVVTALGKMPHGGHDFTRISAYLHAAQENGYAGKEYCQGGIYVLPFRTLERMSCLQCFDHPEDWLPLSVPEDVMMGMFTRAVGLESTDFSLPGEPFGSNWRGLAYPPHEMLQRGHALIHSVKTDAQYSERALRRFFKSQRNKGRKYATSAFSVSASV